MDSIRQWQERCEESQFRVDMQREKGETLGWRLGAYLLLLLVCIDVIMAVVFAVKTLLF